MGFFNEEEEEALSILCMAVHLVGGGGPFEPQEPLGSGEHAGFLVQRVKEAAVSSVHEFDPRSGIKALLEQVASGDITFAAGAQEISRRFANDHVTASRDGAFFVLELETDEPDVRVYALMKYDYQQAIELYDQDGRAALRQILQAFVRDKRAVQKACIVRVRDGEAEKMVAAFDRTGTAPDLTQYFQKFLEVRRERDTKELSVQLNRALLATFKLVKEHLPNQDVRVALSTAKDSLRLRQQIDDAGVQDAVLVAVGQADDVTKVKVSKVLGRQMRSHKLSGLEFAPDRSVLRQAPRSRVKTQEGVILIYPSSLENGVVHREPTEDGGLIITVRTSAALVEDEPLPP